MYGVIFVEGKIQPHFQELYLFDKKYRKNKFPVNIYMYVSFFKKNTRGLIGF